MNCPGPAGPGIDFRLKAKFWLVVAWAIRLMRRSLRRLLQPLDLVLRPLQNFANLRDLRRIV